MAEIRCPMCGKPNPEELDVCQFCQARLKPLIAHPDDSLDKSVGSSPLSDNKMTDSNGVKNSLPDWLRAMGRSEEEPIEGTNNQKRIDKEDKKQETEAYPDWLGKWQENADFFVESEKESEEEPLMEEETVPDWLLRPDSPDEETEPQEPQKSKSDELIDSTEKERKSDEFGTTSEQIHEEESAELADESLSEKVAPEPEGTREPNDEIVVPDWLRKMSESSLEESESTKTGAGISPGEASLDEISDFNDLGAGDLELPEKGIEEDVFEPDEGEEQDRLIRKSKSREEKSGLTKQSKAPSSKKEYSGLISRLRPANEEELTQHLVEEEIIPSNSMDVVNGEGLHVDVPEEEDKELFPDWLSEKGSLEEPSSEAETLGWMSKLDEVEEESVDQQAESPEKGAIPDWIAQLKPTAELKQGPEAEELSSEASIIESEEPIELPQVKEEEIESELSDVAEKLGEQEEPPGKEEEELIPDWLKEMGEPSLGEPGITLAPEEPSPSAEPSDWIAEFGDDQVEELIEQPSLDEDEEESKRIESIKKEEEPASQIEVVETEDEEPFQQPVIEEHPILSDSVDELEGLDQLTELSEEEPPSDLLSHVRTTEKLPYEREKSDLNDELRISSDEKPEQISEEEKGFSGRLLQQVGESEIDATKPEKEELGLLPDWLSELELDEGIKEQDEEVSVLDKKPIDVDEEDIIVPDWIKELDNEEYPKKVDKTEMLVAENLEDHPPEQAMEQVDIPHIDFGEEEDIDQDLLKGDTLPAWLSSVSLQDTDIEEKDLEDHTEIKGLEQAELPNWLQAMRPQKTPEPIHEDLMEVADHADHIEGTGPLAGIHSVLSAEPEIAEIKTPQEISFGLSITKEQRTSAKLLKELLVNEHKVKPVKEQKKDAAPKIWRMIIGLILSIVIGGITLFGTHTISIPDPLFVPAGVMDANNIVNLLPTNAQVLIAIDYDPNNAGEMNAAARPIIDHLMLKGAYLTLISTSPTGPALGEYLIGSVLVDHKYQRDTQYVNLGYLPGGASGLLSFMLAPQRIVPLSFDGEDAWNTTPLSGIEKLSDFDLMIIVANNFQTVQSWIEQSQSNLSDTPMIVVSSAQSSPLVMPYYENPLPQIEGLVDGFMGGAAYEQIIGREGLGREYWDAYMWGLVIALGAILVSAVLYFVKQYTKQGNQVRQEGEDTE